MNPPECLLLAGLCISIALTVIIASLSASGPYHLLPFVPLCLYMVAVMAAAPSRESELAPQETIAIIFLLSLLAYGPGIYLVNSNLMTYYNRTEQHEKIHELQTYLETYPNAQIGVSDDAHYSDTDYRILSVLAGHPLHIDFAAWGDLEYGVPERNIVRFIERCEVPTWILPLGTPFTKSSWYTERPMLSDDFRRTFSTNYQLIKIGQFYQVWGCRNSVKKKSNADLN